MNIALVVTALLWGLCSGFCLVKAAEALINIITGLHGLFMRRWKWLAKKAAPGQIDYGILLDLMLRMLAQAVFFLVILDWSNGWVGENTPFHYDGIGLQLWAAALCFVVAFMLRSSLRRIKIAWRIGHEVGYAQKRKRTLLLRR